VAAPVTRTHKGRPDQAIAYLAWPTTDFFADPQEARAVRLMEGVMDLRLTDELREAQGATYSPQVGSNASITYPGYGYLATSVEMPPDKLVGFYADARKIAAALRDQPVTADELERARKPRIEAIQRARAGNGYWLGQLSGAQADPRRIEAVRNAIPGLEKVTATDIQRVARQYLREDRTWSLSVTPATTAPAVASAASTGR
jgi:zinc protease